MALLGSLEAAQQLLEASPASGWNEDEVSRLTSLQGFVTRWIERATGVVFGEAGAPAAEDRIVSSYGISPYLFLPTGALAVSAVSEWPDWSGSVWSGGTLVPANQYMLVGSRDGYFGRLERIGGYLWSGRYRISGTWAGAVEAVPDDVTYVANWLMSELFKQEQVGPAGFTGPDGATIPIRDPFKSRKVTDTIAAYARKGSPARGRAIVV